MIQGELIEQDTPSSAAAKRFAKEAKATVEEIIRLRTQADQLSMELANAIAARASQLSADLSYDDMHALLSAVARVLR